MEDELSFAKIQIEIKTQDGTQITMSHLSSAPPGVATGSTVKEDQVVAVSGNTENAGGLTSTNEDHVHLEVKDPNGN